MIDKSRLDFFKQIANTNDIAYCEKTKEHTQLSGERIILQELILAYEQLIDQSIRLQDALETAITLMEAHEGAIDEEWYVDREKVNNEYTRLIKFLHKFEGI